MTCLKKNGKFEFIVYSPYADGFNAATHMGKYWIEDVEQLVDGKLPEHSCPEKYAIGSWEYQEWHEGYEDGKQEFPLFEEQILWKLEVKEIGDDRENSTLCSTEIG